MEEFFLPFCEEETSPRSNDDDAVATAGAAVATATEEVAVRAGCLGGSGYHR